MMSPNDNVYKFEGYDGGEIEIAPNWIEGYKTYGNEDIVCLAILDSLRKSKESAISIDLQTAKLMIEALQEIIDYVEDNI